MSSVVVKSIDDGRVRRAADAWARRLIRDRAEVEEIVFFGSFERDTFAPGSDLDVLVVLHDSDRPPRDRVPDYLPGAFPVGIDLLPYTRDEIRGSLSPGLLAEIRRSRWRHLRPGCASALG